MKGMSSGAWKHRDDTYKEVEKKEQDSGKKSKKAIQKSADQIISVVREGLQRRGFELLVITVRHIQSGVARRCGRGTWKK